jgi:hypothetical protein
MSSFFSYDSKPMQILMFLGDLMFLNILFLISCIPIVTIGAAQAGLHTAVKVLLDKEDDSSVYAAYFRGFTSGFFTVTLSWGLMTLLLAFVLILGVTSIRLGSPAWIVLLALIIVALFQTMVPIIHSRLGCKWWQLIRNAWFFIFAHPIRCIGATLVIWLPAVAFADAMVGFWQIVDLYTIFMATPVWGTLYFSTAFCFAHSFLKKPFKVAIDHFNETHGIVPEGENAENPETTEEDAEMLIEQRLQDIQRIEE